MRESSRSKKIELINSNFENFKKNTSNSGLGRPCPAKPLRPGPPLQLERHRPRLPGRRSLGALRQEGPFHASQEAHRPLRFGHGVGPGRGAGGVCREARGRRLPQRGREGRAPLGTERQGDDAEAVCWRQGQGQRAKRRKGQEGSSSSSSSSSLEFFFLFCSFDKNGRFGTARQRLPLRHRPGMPGGIPVRDGTDEAARGCSVCGARGARRRRGGSGGGGARFCCFRCCRRRRRRLR